MTWTLRILYEDNHVLGVVKPAGLLAQGDRTGDVSALELARRHVKEAYDKPGRAFLGLVHRLDRPVSGVMVFARTSKAAARLARSFHDRRVEKTYLCVVEGAVADDSGELTALIERTHARSRITAKATGRSRESVLAYRVLARVGDPAPLRAPLRRAPARVRRRDAPAEAGAMTLLEVTPRTGRHHQIRLQLSAAGHPIVGDLKYRARAPLPDRSIALHAARLRFPHPVRDEIIELSAPPPSAYPWQAFAPVIARSLPNAPE